MNQDQRREQACELFLSHTNMAYISPIEWDGELQSALYDDDGEAFAIGHPDLLRMVAHTNGLVLLTRQ